jgi:hypothetical protein
MITTITTTMNDAPANPTIPSRPRRSRAPSSLSGMLTEGPEHPASQAPQVVDRVPQDGPTREEIRLASRQLRRAKRRLLLQAAGDDRRPGPLGEALGRLGLGAPCGSSAHGDDRGARSSASSWSSGSM